MQQSRLITFFCISAFFFNIYAHIDKTSLSIKGGETFKTGDKVQISWKVAIFHHRPHIVYFSPATNQPWQKIDSIPEKQGVMDMNYTWTVPPTISQSARIRIFQSFVQSPGEQTNDYTIVSNMFTISSGATGMVSGKSSGFAVRHTAQRSLNGALFDLNGRRVDDSYVAVKSVRTGILRKFIGDVR